MGAVTALAAAELRRSWRALVAIGLLAGLAGGAALGALALQQRTTSAPGRLVVETGLEDARVPLFGTPELAGELRDLPAVASSWQAENAVGQVLSGDVGVRFASISFGPPPPPGLFTPVAVQGTLPDPGDAAQIAVTQDFAEEYGVGPGGTLRLAMLTVEEVFQFDTGFGVPDGPTLDLRVTGVVRLADRGGNGFGPLFAGTAFHDAHRGLSPGATMLLRLREGQRDAFERQFAALSADLPPAGEFGPVRPEFPVEELSPRVSTAKSVLGGGLLLIAGLAGAAGLLATTQALSRLAAGGAGSQRTESALGLTPADRVLARLLPAGIAAGLAAGLSVAGVLLAGLIEPLGGLRRYEPHPGWSPDASLAALGALAVAALVLALSAATTLAAGRPRTAQGGRGRGVVLPGWLRAGPVVAAGTGLALTRDPRHGRSPARLTVTTAAIGIAGVLATAVFVTSLEQLEDSPERYGWQADFAIADIREEQLDALAADPEVVDLQVSEQATVRLQGRLLEGQTVINRKGALPTTVVEGRLPVTAGEIALGPRIADQLGLGVGDRADLGDSGTRLITGIALGTPVTSDTAGETALFTRAGLATAQIAPPLRDALVRAADHERGTALANRYAQQVEVLMPTQPSVVRNLLDLSRVPLALCALLVLLSAGALTHVLLQTTRRRSRDLAVLRALGLTPRQTGASLLVMATTSTLIGLAVGVPVGLLAGRLAWLEAASATGALHEVQLPVLLLALVLPAAVLAAALVAVVPARRAARLSPATLLHAD